MSNPILTRIRAKSDEIGIEAAALYYSGDGPGKKISPAQLQKVIDEKEMPTPRMCLRVCEDLEEALRSMPRTAQESRADSLDVSNGRLRIENDHLRVKNVNLANDNAALLARIRTLESQAVAASDLASQSFGIPQPFVPAAPVAETPLAVQPWASLTANQTPVRVEAAVVVVGE